MINDNGIAARSQDICQLGNQLRAESDAAAIAEPIASGRQETLLLQNLAKDLGQSECIEGAISAVHQHLSRIVTYDTLAVYVRHHENLEPIRIIGQHEHLFSREGFPIEKGLSGWVAEHRSPILNGAASDECCYTDDPDLINRLQAVVAVPLEGSSGFTGVLALYHSKQNAFGQDDLRILQAVSTSLGRATESALRFKKVEESAVADHLTEIPNARALAVHLKDEIDGTSLEQSTVGAPLRDLNGFKQVNDRFGHSKGDGVLRNVARGLRSDTGPQSRSRGAGDNQPAMYKVTIQSTPAKQIVWKVAASGRWTPGQPPQLAKHLLSAEVLNELFNVTPSETDQSGRNQIQCGDTLYGVVFRRIPKWERQ
jgi:GAF domain-containing protein